jgi:hypothetical protein
VELTGPDGEPISFVVAEVHHILHDVIPADYVVMLIPTPVQART